jgi:hypothetical protein
MKDVFPMFQFGDVQIDSGDRSGDFHLGSEV